MKEKDEKIGRLQRVNVRTYILVKHRVNTTTTMTHTTVTLNGLICPFRQKRKLKTLDLKSVVYNSRTLWNDM